jgi:hypothetical protein
MLAHFCHPAVFSSYLVALGASLFLSRLPYSAAVTLAVGISVALMIVDYLVHSAVHGWKWLRYPLATTTWIVAVVVALVAGFVTQGWQLAGIFLAQGLWDNSWHARRHHWAEGGPRAELDQPIVRWGSVAVVACIVLIPNLL